MFGQPWSRRQSSAASISSIRTSHSEDAEIAKDCIITTTAEVTAFVSDGPPPTSPINDETHEAGTYSQAHCDPLGGNETQALWKCMLELQQRYGCYNSRRMDLAVTAGDEAMSLMPNPFILDTLNDSVIDLPEEGREMLSRFLRCKDSPSSAIKQKSRHRFWKC